MTVSKRSKVSISDERDSASFGLHCTFNVVYSKFKKIATCDLVVRSYLHSNINFVDRGEYL